MVAKMILSWLFGAGLTASIFLTIFVNEALGGSLIFVFGFPTPPILSQLVRDQLG